MVGELVGPTHERYQPLLMRSRTEVAPRVFSVDKFEVLRPLDGEAVLLIDDTWTTGASAQSAAATLRDAGAGPVAAAVIGRHMNREWDDNDRRLGRIPLPFDWNECALCAPGS
jgi:adenine/guanine phosphoribosyltransferase-like PRPP-binding protein